MLSDPRRRLSSLYTGTTTLTRITRRGQARWHGDIRLGLGRLIVDLLSATGATGVYLVAHSMGGLVRAHSYRMSMYSTTPTQSSRRTAMP